MKNLFFLAIGTAVLCALNIGCTASAGVHPSSTAKPASNVQVAYIAILRAK